MGICQVELARVVRKWDIGPRFPNNPRGLLDNLQDIRRQNP